MSEIEFSGASIDEFNFLTLFEFDSGLAQRSRDLHGRIMVDKIAIDHSLTVGVFVNRIAKNAHCMERWRSSKTNLHRVEVLQHTPVLRDIVVLAPELQFIV